MTTTVLTPGKTLYDLIPRTHRFSSGSFPLRDGAQLRYVVLPHEPQNYAILTRDDGESAPEHYLATREQFDAVAAEQVPLSSGEFLQGFTTLSGMSLLGAEGPGAKIVDDELRDHKAADENKLQTRQEAAFQQGELQLISQIQEIFRTNAWSEFLAKSNVRSLVHTVTRPDGEPVVQTTYMGVLDTLVPETIIFERTRILICSRTVDAKVEKEFFREQIVKSTKVSAGIGLSMGGSAVDFQPMEGDPAFSQGQPVRANANGPGISFNGEMVKQYHRLAIRAALRMTIGVSKVHVEVIPRVP